jgi:SnoaL-like domain
VLTRRELLHWITVLGAGGTLAGHALTAEGRDMKNLEQVIQRLVDREEISELMARYCRHADLLDAAGMAACFTDDCIVAYVPASMAPPARSRQELLGFLNAYFPNSVSSSHYVTNVELIFDTPDQVTAATYMYSWQRFKTFPAAADCHRYGRYELRIVRTDDGWRFSRLNLLSAGEYGGARIAEQFGRPWPPRFE